MDAPRRRLATTEGRGAGSGFQLQYSYTACAADLAMGDHWSQTAPVARFVRRRVVSIILADGFATLTDGTDRKAGDIATTEAIADPGVYRERLSKTFGLALSAQDVARVFINPPSC